MIGFQGVFNSHKRRLVKNGHYFPRKVFSIPLNCKGVMKSTKNKEI